MNSEDQMVLENIDEFVNDEGKIVTYKFLSMTLSIHTNKSKKLLEDYLKEKDDNLFEVVYFIGGIKTDGLVKNLRFTLVKKGSLEAIKERFDTITTCHIYSIQKSKLKNFDTLHSTDCDLVKQSLHDLHNYSSVQCNFKRRDAQIPVATSGRSATEQTAAKERPVKDNKTAAPIKNEEKKKPMKETQAALFFGGKTSKDGKEEKVESEDTKKPAPPKKETKTSIASAFSRSKPKKESNEESKSQVIDKPDEIVEKDLMQTEEYTTKDKKIKKPTEKKDVKLEKRSSKKRKVIMQGSDDEDDFQNFLQKTKKKEKAENVETEEVSDTKTTPKYSFEIADVDEDENEDVDVDVIAPTPEPVKKPKSKRRKKDEPDSSNSKPDKVSPKNVKTKKKNKAEKAPEEENDNNTVENQPSPLQKECDDDMKEEGEKRNKVEERCVAKRRKRRQVMKAKQYVDEDGFMVTQKVYESESYSESDRDNDEQNEEGSNEESKRDKTTTAGGEVKESGKEKSKELQSKAKVQQHANKKAKTQSNLSSFFKKLK